MNAGEYAAYIERAIPEYAQDKVDSGQWSAASSLKLSREAYSDLLPKGLETPQHFLFTLHEAETHTRVGVLWYAIQERGGQRVAYVYDIQVEPGHRRRGHACQAFQALEVAVGAIGLSGIALHVFGHNKVAQMLYAKLGYETTNINLFKKLSISRT